MKAVIMAGGFGTRLRPLTCNIPKPMVPVVNRPIMEHIIRRLHAHNITDIVVTLFYHPDVITNYFGDGSRFGVRQQYVRAEADYGTAGSVRNAANLLGERFLIISGDVLTDINLTKAINYHQERNAKVTIVLYHSHNPSQYGVVITREDGRIVRFVEKPTWGEVFSDAINTGIYVIEPAILDLVPKGEEFDFSKNLFPLLLERDDALLGYPSDGYWRDVGNLGDYQDAHRDSLAGRVKVEFPGEKVGTSYIGRDTQVNTKATNIKGTVVIGNNCVIGEDVSLSNTVIGDHVIIEPEAVIEDSIIWNECIIRRAAQLSSDVLANNVAVGEEAVLAENVFIGEKCFIGSKARLTGNIKLWPAKIVDEGPLTTPGGLNVGALEQPPERVIDGMTRQPPSPQREKHMPIGRWEPHARGEVLVEGCLRRRMQGHEPRLLELAPPDDQPVRLNVVDHQVLGLGDAQTGRRKQPEERAKRKTGL